MQLVRIRHLAQLRILAKQVVTEPRHHGVVGDDPVLVDLQDLIYLSVRGTNQVGQVLVIAVTEVKLPLLALQVERIERKVLQRIPAILDDSECGQHRIGKLSFCGLQELNLVVVELKLALQAFHQRRLQLLTRHVHRLNCLYRVQHLLKVLCHGDDFSYAFVRVGTEVLHGIRHNLFGFCFGVLQLARCNRALYLFSSQTAFVNEHAKDEAYIPRPWHLLRPFEFCHRRRDQGVQMPFRSVETLRLNLEIIMDGRPRLVRMLVVVHDVRILREVVGLTMLDVQ
mmetsp:Transcript_102303/g.243920  ORF Transcript_102303/g.243920 Transcript_102303/m.243920 type:complete len:283 (+) Transcript_102303:172-1020(+)